MFRVAVVRTAEAMRSAVMPTTRLTVGRFMSSKHEETDEEFDAR